ELRESQLEPVVVELLPRRARIDRDVLVADPPVAGHQLEAELAEVARLAVAPEPVGLRAAPARPHAPRRDPLHAPDADARAPWPAGVRLAHRELLDVDR